MQSHSAEELNVRIRVQVIDMQPQVLDLSVSTYMPARDVAKRVVRQAGLPAYWPNRQERRYWLRARGRLLGDGERLDQVGVINGELIHLLPEPPHGSGVLEQRPDYPETRDYPARGNLAVITGAGVTVLWALAWGLALSASRDAATVTLPGLALGLMACTLSRHLFGGQGGALRIAAVGLGLSLPMVALAVAIPIAFGDPAGEVLAQSIAGGVTAIIGVVLGWLAWWGAVEPLPPAEILAAEQQIDPTTQALACGICGLGATPDVQTYCNHGCGRVFHTGCHQARLAVAQQDPRLCGICGAGLRV